MTAPPSSRRVQACPSVPEASMLTLSAGWERNYSRSTGVKYYVNSTSGETQVISDTTRTSHDAAR
jgi:hypothetical protein